jgi:outer membrane protein assembly factor BamB
MKATIIVYFVLASIIGANAALPPDYKGKPFEDSVYKGGPQVIPGKVECAYYDQGGEGVAYHDTDPVNNGSGKLNQEKMHQRPHATPYHWNFRTHEAVDVSYTTDFADFNHNQNLVAPATNQFYIGWTENGEWCNYTVDVKKAGTYKIVALYGNEPNSFKFSVNNKPACECKLPLHTGSFHKWNKAEVGSIVFSETGLQLLTLHYNKGNNFAWFEFALIENVQDWPQWRGVNRDGKVAGFTAPATWPTNLTRKWQAAVGKGDSSPVLAGEKLYAFGRREADEVLLCLDASSGKTLWEANYPAGRVVTGPPARHPGPRSTPVISEGKICTLGVGVVLSCFDTDKGALLWRKQSTNDYLGASTKSDASMSPIVVDGSCIVHVGGGTNGAVIAFDLASGEPKWKSDGDGPANSSPVVMNVGGKKHLVTLTAKNMIGLDLANGKLLSQLPFEATQGNNTTPIVDGSMVYFTGQGKGLFAVKIEQQVEGFAATPIWTNKQAGSRFTTPVLKDGLLYGYNNSFFCASSQTGETLWTDTVKRGQSAAMLDAGSVILALTLNGEFTAFKPGNKEYSELARIKVSSSETWAHPVVSGKRIYVKDSEMVSLWSFE